MLTAQQGAERKGWNMNSVYGRPRENANRWMINVVPVMPKKRIDWALIVEIIYLFFAVAYCFWAIVVR